MSSADAVLACVLSLLGRSADSMPPIQLVSQAPDHASELVEAYVRPYDPTIYIVTSTAVFRDAQAAGARCGSNADKKLASILAHEEWHVRHGTDERGAYDAQLKAMIRLGVPGDSPMYRGVIRSMLAVIDSKEPEPAGISATRAKGRR
jgi:hypothetical protein